MTGQQMWQLVRMRHPTAGVTETLVMLNNALKEFHRRTRTLEKIVQITPEADGVTYTFPTDLIEVIGITYNESGTPAVQFTEVEREPDKVHPLVGRQERVYNPGIYDPVYIKKGRTSAKIGLVSSSGTIEALAGGSVVLEYSYFEADITESTSPVLDPAWHEAIVYRACEGMYVGEENRGDRSYCYNRWRDALKEARQQANQDADDEEWDIVPDHF